MQMEQQRETQPRTLQQKTISKLKLYMNKMVESHNSIISHYLTHSSFSLDARLLSHEEISFTDYCNSPNNDTNSINSLNDNNTNYNVHSSNGNNSQSNNDVIINNTQNTNFIEHNENQMNEENNSIEINMDLLEDEERIVLLNERQMKITNELKENEIITKEIESMRLQLNEYWGMLQAVLNEIAEKEDILTNLNQLYLNELVTLYRKKFDDSLTTKKSQTNGIEQRLTVESINQKYKQMCEQKRLETLSQQQEQQREKEKEEKEQKEKEMEEEEEEEINSVEEMSYISQNKETNTTSNTTNEREQETRKTPRTLTIEEQHEIISRDIRKRMYILTSPSQNEIDMLMNEDNTEENSETIENNEIEEPKKPKQTRRASRRTKRLPRSRRIPFPPKRKKQVKKVVEKVEEEEDEETNNENEPMEEDEDNTEDESNESENQSKRTNIRKSASQSRRDILRRQEEQQRIQEEQRLEEERQKFLKDRKTERKIRKIIPSHYLTKEETICYFTGKEIHDVLCDVGVDNWERDSQIIRSSIINKSNIAILFETHKGWELGGYISEKVSTMDEFIEDSNSFLMAFHKHYYVKMKLKKKNPEHAFKLYSGDDERNLLQFGQRDIGIYQNESKGYYAYTDTHSTFRKDEYIAGKMTSFALKRVQVFQLV